MFFLRNIRANLTFVHSTRQFCTSKSKKAAQSEVAMAKDHLFQYTSGRWLWNEQEQLGARLRRFNVPLLQQIACRAVGAERCVSLEKIGEGNYNKAYRLIMNDGQKVIVKIPHPNAGPPSLTTASEVATMEYARTILQIPVPKVFDWSATTENPVEAEYIIMEEAKGLRLHEAWRDLPLRAKGDLIGQIVEIERKLLSVSFDRIGSLYFSDCGFPNCMPIKATSDFEDLNKRVQEKFQIGPITRREFWEKDRSRLHKYHGPWSSSIEYLKSIANREIDWIQNYADAKKEDINPWQYMSAEQHSPKAHVAALQKVLSAVPLIVPRDPDLTSPRLWHPDFHAGNIFIDGGRISSIIDWQGTWTTPAFVGASPPLLLDYGVDFLMKLPDNFKSLDEPEKNKLRNRVSQSILIHSYETKTAKHNPLMNKVMRLPHGRTLKLLEAFTGSTWDNCLYPLEDCLIKIEKEWEFFDTGKPCPYHHTATEVQKHYEDAELFNKGQDFWKALEGVLTDEGYTSNENYSKALDLLRDLRTAGLTHMEGLERDEYDRMTRWISERSVSV